MLSTIHRRRVLEYFQTKESITFSELKKQFLETKEMNPTTLYRILDTFLREHIIHEIRVNDERIFTLCHGHKEEWVKLSYCTKCSHIAESHFPLSPEALKSESVEYLKSCPFCK